MAYAPKWKGTLGVDYRIRTAGSVDVVLAAQSSNQSKQLSQLAASAAVRSATTVHDYAMVDLSAAIVDPDDRYRITFLIKNLFDESFASPITSGGQGGSFRYIVPREAGR